MPYELPINARMGREAGEARRVAGSNVANGGRGRWPRLSCDAKADDDVLRPGPQKSVPAMGMLTRGSLTKSGLPMRLSLDDSGQQFVIRGFTETSVRINHEEYTRSFLLTPERIITDLTIKTVSELDPLALNSLIVDNPEVLIVGTGPRTLRASAAVQAAFLRAGVGIEFMDTGAACRTFTVLASELRRVSLLVLFPENGPEHEAKNPPESASEHNPENSTDAAHA
jgi:uncharacterized protein